MSLWFTFGCGLFFWYWAADHNWKTRWPRTDTNPIWDTRLRSTGQVAVAVLSALMFPVARSSPILQILGISWDKSIKFHRWAGITFMFFLFLHMVSSYIFLYTKSGWSGIVESLWPFPPVTALPNRDNFTMPLIQWLTWLSFITIGIIAVYEPIRRSKYDLFLICHHLTYITLIPATLWHAAAAWEFLLPALSLYLSDRLVRLYRGTKSVPLLPTTVGDFQGSEIDYILNRSHSPFSLHSIDRSAPPQLPISSVSSPLQQHVVNAAQPTGPGVRLINYGDAGKYIELRIDNSNKSFVYFPGHYFFLNIAEISLFEWHPMTCSGHVHAQSHELSFLIKCEGSDSSWTRSLYNYIQTTTQKQLPADNNTTLDIPLTVSLDGPYGCPVDFNQYDNVILVAGGAGITPIKSIYNSLWLSFLHDFIGGDETKSKLKTQLLTQLESTRKLNGIPGCDGSIGDNGNNNDNDTPNTNNIITLPKHAHLFFAAKDPSLFECMADTLGHVPVGRGVPFTCELLCSKGGALRNIRDGDFDMVLNTPEYDPNVKVSHNLQHHFSFQHQDDKELDTITPLERSICKAFGVKQLSDIKNPERTVVFACGPYRLTKQAKELAIRYGFRQHEEEFEL